MNATRPAAFLALFLASSLVVAGCSGSSRSPITGGAVSIEGSVTDTNGQPIAGREVVLHNNSIADLLLFFPLAIVPRDRGLTDANGEFHLIENGAMANGFFGARPFVAKVSTGHWTDPAAEVRFKLMKQTQPIPPLQLWDGNGAVAANSGDLDFSWTALSGAQEYTLELWSGQDRFTDIYVSNNTTARVSRRLVQDFALNWSTQAVTRVVDPDQTFTIRNRSSIEALPRQSLVPPTRGQVAAADGWGPLSQATDGSLSPVSFVQANGISPTGRIEIDLGSVQTLDQVFVYGWYDEHSSGVTVGVFNAPGGSASANPAAMSSVISDAQIIDLPPNTTGRYLVVEPFSPAATILEVAEISAF